MKLTELLTQLLAIKEQYGDLDIQIVTITDYGEPEIYMGDLDRIEVEERTTLCLISEEQ